MRLVDGDQHQPFAPQLVREAGRRLKAGAPMGSIGVSCSVSTHSNTIKRIERGIDRVGDQRAEEA